MMSVEYDGDCGSAAAAGRSWTTLVLVNGSSNTLAAGDRQCVGPRGVSAVMRWSDGEHIESGKRLRLRADQFPRQVDQH